LPDSVERFGLCVSCFEGVSTKPRRICQCCARCSLAFSPRRVRVPRDPAPPGKEPVRSRGVYCRGKLQATRCKFEDNKRDGVFVNGGETKLVECVVRNNGGTACPWAMTVAAAEHSETDTLEVSSGNGGHDWATRGGGEIAGLAEGIQVKVL